MFVKKTGESVQNFMRSNRGRWGDDLKKILVVLLKCKPIGPQTTYLQKTLEIEHVFVSSQYLVGVVNHICCARNALKTS